MKILEGSFQCEANTFSEARAAREDFEVFYGHKVTEMLASSEVFRDAGADIVPLAYISALPTGMIKRDAFEFYMGILMEGIRAEKDVDGIFLYLHGSMYVEGIGSGEERLIQEIRRAVGDGIPISITLDFHGNLSKGLIEGVNAIEGFRTAPHVDQEDTQRRAAKALLTCIRKGRTPIPRFVRLPFLGGDACVTNREPFMELTRELERMDDREDIISCAFFNGQPWYDTPYTGNCAVVSKIDGSGYEEALMLAKIFWEGREKLVLEEAVAVEEAIEISLKNKEGVLFVTDSGDNTTAGAKGSGTLLLRKYLEGMNSQTHAKSGVLICGILDRENTNLMLEQEIDTLMVLTLCRGKKQEQEIETTIVVTLKKKGVVYGWAGDEVGEGVLLECQGIEIVLTNARAAFTSPMHFEKMGIDPFAYRVIVLKMGYLFPKLKEISSQSLFVLTPGVSTNDFASLPYHNLIGKRYPIEQDICWDDIVQEAKKEVQ